MAGVFGGEAHSGYLARGGTVGAEDPALLALLRNWIDEVAGAGAEWVFWDEPDLGLGHGSDAVVSFLAEVTSYARERGLRNSICLTATVPNVPAFHRLAALDSVDDIGTDLYYKLELDERDRTRTTTSASGRSACARSPTRTARRPTSGCRRSSSPRATSTASAAA